MKYKLRKDLSLKLGFTTLYRIELLRDCAGYQEGYIGGYIESEFNLSQEGEALVSGEALVYGEARISGEAHVCLNMNISKKEDLFHCLNFKYPITVSLTGIIVGCKHYKDYDEFKRLSPKDGKDNGYSKYDMKYLNSVIKNAITYLKNKQ